LAGKLIRPPFYQFANKKKTLLKFIRQSEDKLQRTTFFIGLAAKAKTEEAFYVLRNAQNIDVNIVDEANQRFSALHYFCCIKETPIKDNTELLVALLLKKGINVNIQTVQGDTALMYACKNNPHIASLLLTHPTIQLDIQNCEGTNGCNPF